MYNKSCMIKHYRHDRKHKGDKRLRAVNRLLFAAIIAINGYVILAPLWPNVTYRVKTATTKPLAETDFSTLDRRTNHLVIPSLRLDKPINEGSDASTLNKGIWHEPTTSAPDKGSNTVLSGHRWLYNNPTSAVFYNLDKVRKDDKIVAVWNQKIYVYRVIEVKTVPPTAVEIENPSTDNHLTLYTCTPLWTATDRLVIVSKLEQTL